MEQVDLQGVDAVDADDVTDGLANRPPRGFFIRRYVRLDPLQVELDRRRIETFYKQRGYFSARVEGPASAPGERPDGVILTWRISEGPPTQVATVQLEDAPPDLRAALEAQVRLQPGERLRHDEYRAAKLRLRAVMVQGGYAHARVEGEVAVDRLTGEAWITFQLDPGPRVALGLLTVEGLVRTPTSAVTARQTWQAGDPFSPQTLERMRGRLYEVDQYAGVRLDYRDAAPGPVADIVARVEEAEQNELQLGVGGGFDRANVQLRLRGRYKRRSFPFPLTNLELEATPEYSLLRADLTQGRFTPQARATWTWHDLMAPRLRLENTVGITFRQLEAFSWFGPDVGQTLSRPFWDDRLRAALGWHLFAYSFTSDLSPADEAALVITETLPVIFLEPSLTFDARDDGLAPRRGVLARLGLELGRGVRSEAGSYAVLMPEVRGYLPLGSRLSLAARLRLSATLAGRLPAPRRFFAGGASSQRGFSQRRLSTTVEATNDSGEVRTAPVGGETIVETGVEARLRIVQLLGFWLGAAAFIDGADLAPRLGDIDLLRLHWAAGGGLRYYTPIGAVRLDVGVRLNRKGATEPAPGDAWAWHLTLGEAF